MTGSRTAAKATSTAAEDRRLPACSPGASCESAPDCSSRVCIDLECQEPSCADDTQNQTETDVDCGGGL